MFSSLLQKQHFPSPFHFLLSKLSLVRITPFLRYHKKILIFIGSLNFQAIQSSCALCSFTRFVYIDLTEKIDFWFAFQTKKSCSSSRFGRQVPPWQARLISIAPCRCTWCLNFISCLVFIMIVRKHRTLEFFKPTHCP